VDSGYLHEAQTSSPAAWGSFTACDRDEWPDVRRAPTDLGTATSVCPEQWYIHYVDPMLNIATQHPRGAPSLRANAYSVFRIRWVSRADRTIDSSCSVSRVQSGAGTSDAFLTRTQARPKHTNCIFNLPASSQTLTAHPSHWRRLPFRSHADMIKDARKSLKAASAPPTSKAPRVVCARDLPTEACAPAAQPHRFAWEGVGSETARAR